MSSHHLCLLIVNLLKQIHAHCRQVIPFQGFTGSVQTGTQFALVGQGTDAAGPAPAPGQALPYSSNPVQSSGTASSPHVNGAHPAVAHSPQADPDGDSLLSNAGAGVSRQAGQAGSPMKATTTPANAFDPQSPPSPHAFLSGELGLPSPHASPESPIPPPATPSPPASLSLSHSTSNSVSQSPTHASSVWPLPSNASPPAANAPLINASASLSGSESPNSTPALHALPAPGFIAPRDQAPPPTTSAIEQASSDVSARNSQINSTMNPTSKPLVQAPTSKPSSSPRQTARASATPSAPAPGPDHADDGPAAAPGNVQAQNIVQDDPHKDNLPVIVLGSLLGAAVAALLAGITSVRSSVMQQL